MRGERIPSCLFVIGLRTFGVAMVLLFAAHAHAQTFSSGSTGADGALEGSDWNGNGVLTLQLPPSGIFNFTTIDVPADRELRFLPNASNTPVVMLAQGNVTVSGAIRVQPPAAYGAAGPNGNRQPGPGGFFGGFPQGNGFGPGGGVAGGAVGAGENNGRWVGPLSLVPIVGGSGAGGGALAFCPVQAGGGGGGAIVIASSSSITISGNIHADGVHGGFCSGSLINVGAGGAIRLVGNAVNVVSGSLTATGGTGNHGVIRIEAPAGSRTLTGGANPAPVLAAINPALVPAAAPVLTLTSIGGVPIPSGSGSRADVVDLLLPTQLTDPIPLVVAGTHIPVGSQVTLAINGSPGATATTGTLTGTDASSTATLQISGLNRSTLNFLFASVTFEVPLLAQAGGPEGPHQVASLRVDTRPGEESRVAFLRRDGTEIALNQVPPEIRQRFGR